MTVKPHDFTHSEDATALENLKAIPMFDTCVKAFLKLGFERQFHGESMAQAIRLGPRQLSHLYRHLPPACALLGIEVPEMFLKLDPQPNAFTYGETKAFITITSGLVECMEEDELRAVIAHECGHIACQHVLYRTMANLLVGAGSELLGIVGNLALPVKLGLQYWTRRSELSADRAAAIVMGGPAAVVDTMVRFAGGPKSVTSGVDIARYQEQAAAYDQLLESKWDQALQGMVMAWMEHPMLALRTREILDWCAGEHFQRLQAGVDASRPPGYCALCGHPIEVHWKHCGHCGTALIDASDPSTQETHNG